MTEQKERACPCANTDKLNTKTLHTQYTTNSGCLQYVGVSYYAADDHGHKFPSSVALRIDRSQYGDLIHWLDFHMKGKDPVCAGNAAAASGIPAGWAALPV